MRIALALLILGLILSGCGQPAYQPSPTVPAATTCIGTDRTHEVVGQRTTVCGTVAQVSYRPDVRGQPTFINFDRPFPNHTFTALIWGRNRPRFSSPPEQQFWPGMRLCVQGLVELYQGKPQIEVTDQAQLWPC